MNRRNLTTHLLLAATCLIGAPVTARADEAPGGAVPAEIVQALVLELRTLERELLEHRLDCEGHEIERLERELERISGERSGLAGRSDDASREQDELQQRLQDPGTDAAQRAYLEAMWERLDGDRSEALDPELERLDGREEAADSRLRELRKRRAGLSRRLESLTDTP